MKKKIPKMSLGDLDRHKMETKSRQSYFEDTNKSVTGGMSHI